MTKPKHTLPEILISEKVAITNQADKMAKALEVVCAYLKIERRHYASEAVHVYVTVNAALESYRKFKLGMK